MTNTSTLVDEHGQLKTVEEMHQERIRLLAYNLYEKRGRVDGSDLDDWLRAESELSLSKLVAALTDS
jgi:hypothetical protein